MFLIVVTIIKTTIIITIRVIIVIGIIVIVIIVVFIADAIEVNFTNWVDCHYFVGYWVNFGTVYSIEDD